MPDNPGLLTDDQKRRIVEWLKQRGAPKHCAACGQNNWNLGAHLVVPSTWMGGGISLGGPSYPLAMLICRNCSHTVLFNAVIMGIVEQMKEETGGGSS